MNRTMPDRTAENPVTSITRGLPKPADPIRHHKAMPYEDVPGFLVALDSSDASPVVKLGFELLILTATRTGELLGARWDELDLEKWRTFGRRQT